MENNQHPQPEIGGRFERRETPSPGQSEATAWPRVENAEKCRDLMERNLAIDQALRQTETENRRLAAQLTEAEDMLREMARGHAEFLSMLVHEFRNPLTPILTSTQLLKRHGLERPDFLESATASIERQVRQLSQMFGDLSDFSRFGQGTIELNLEILELGPLAARVAEAWRPQIEKRRQALRVELLSEPVYVRGDSIRLPRAIESLLAHASRFTPAGGTIRVGLDIEGRFVNLGIRGGSIGIDPAHLDRVFEPCARFEPPLHGGKHEGMGIGLALAKHYARMHGGDILAHGADEGGEFVVCLPLVEV